MRRATLSVGGWLALGLGAVAAVLLVVAGTALIGLRGIDQELRRDLDVVEPRAAGAVDLQVAVFRLGNAARAQALAPTSARHEAVVAAEAAVDAGLSSLRPHDDEPGDAEAFAPLPSRVAAYRAGAHALATARAEDVPAREARLREAWEALLPSLDAYTDLQRRQLFEAAAAVVRRRERAELLLVTGLAVAVALLAGVGVLIAWTVRRPLRDLVRLTRNVAAGDFASAAALAPRPPGAPSRNELVELGAAFGAMARALDERERRIAAQHEALQGSNQALREQNEALRRSEEALRDADRRKDEFLAVLSHELRNPLAPIVNGLALLARAEPGGPQAKRAREIVGRQVRQLVRLVDDLLDVTRISRGKVSLRREEVDLTQIVRHVTEDHRPILDRSGLRLELALPEGPVLAWLDPERIAQVVANLVQNSAKFTPDGGTVWVTCEVEGGRAILRIRDDGEGIPPELLPQVFVPFVQAEMSVARSRGGLGLGLALVKGLVELHGGTVAASSGGRGCGAEFTVELPVGPRRRAEPAGATAAEAAV